MKHVIQPGTAHAVHLKAGQALTITDVEGKQVADLVAFTTALDTEWLSPTHSRSSLGRVKLRRGDTLLTNRRRPILRLVRDDVGVHDMAFAMCDAARYELDFGIQGHANCLDAMAAALDRPVHLIPDPVNVFQNSTIDENGDIETKEPRSLAGDSVSFTAVTDTLVAVSACPQDQIPLNGWHPSPIALSIDKESTNA